MNTLDRYLYRTVLVYTLMAMGVLIERLGEDERAARSEFAERFAVFASKPQRTLVWETFTS